MSEAAAAPPPKKNADLPTRFATGVVLIAVAVTATYASGWPFRILATLAAAMMLLEWSDMHRVKRVWTWIGIIGLALALVVGAEIYFPSMANNPDTVTASMLDQALYGFAAVAGLAIVVGLISRRVAMGWGILYIGIPAFALIVLNWVWAELVLWMFVVVWATDIFAYFAGRSIGGPKLAPRISPNKTWAGLGGGIVGAAVCGWIAGQYMEILPIFLLLGAPFALLAQIGDLYESAVKRRRGVKDSGTLLPGHGGVLDRLDGLLPVALATFAVLMALV